MVTIKESFGDRVFNAVNFMILTLVMLLVLYPLILILSSSLSDPNLVLTGQIWLFPKGLTLEGYYRLFQDKEILTGYRNTIFYTVAGTFINLAVTLPAAYALSKKHLAGRSIITIYAMIPMFFSGGLIPTYILIKNLGLINQMVVLLITGVVSTSNLIICRTFFANGVPAELEQAAMIDGCSVTRTFLFIVLPLSKALIGVMALYYGVGHWNSWFSAFIYLSDRSLFPLQLFLREILVQSQIQAQMMAAGEFAVNEELMKDQIKLAELIKYSVIVVSSAPLLIIYPFLQKYFDKGVMLGSLKG